MQIKSRLFIGSSSENLEIAYAIQENLESVAEVTVWTQGIFSPSKYNLESLINALFETDFGIFIFAPNDITTMRNQKHKTIRDNVIFELGMFIGRLGRERCLIFVPKLEHSQLHLPSDLLGLSPVLYDANRRDGNLRAALGPGCSAISKEINKLGVSNLAAKPSQPRILEAQPVQVSGPKITKEELTILKTMITGDFNARSLLGLARDTSLLKFEVNSCITSLIKKGLVEQSKSQKSGQPRWAPTEAGRLLADL